MAAGFVPVRLSSGERPPSGSEAYLPPNICPYVRSILDEAGAGRFAELSGVVFVLSCDAMRRFADIWDLYIGDRFVWRLDIPRRGGEAAVRFFREQLLGLLRALGTKAGRAISDDELEEAIEVVNETRRLVRRISAFRIEGDGLLSGTEFYRIAHAAMSADKVRFNEEARRYIAALEAAEGSGKSTGRPRVLLCGCVADGPALSGAIEDAGAVVVAEDLCTALRHYDGEVETGRDPLEALARRYLGRTACARMTGAESRTRRLLELIEQYQADGVVFHTLKFCDLVQSDLPLVRQVLEKESIPLLHIERDFSDASGGQLSTRFGAFVEVLEGKE